MKNIRELIKTRRSCRAYLDRPIGREVIEALIAEAVWAPTGSNNQPWRFAVVQDKAVLKRYSDMAKKRWLEDLARSPHMRQYEKSIRDPEYNIFYDAPVLVVVYGDPSSFWCVYDCTMVAYNLMLLGEEDGLGSCWIGFAHNVLESEETKRELGIPVACRLVAPIILGHPDPSKLGPAIPRKPYVTQFVGPNR